MVSHSATQVLPCPVILSPREQPLKVKVAFRSDFLITIPDWFGEKMKLAPQKLPEMQRESNADIKLSRLGEGECSLAPLEALR